MAVILKQKNRSFYNGSTEAFRKIYEQTNKKIYSRIIAGAADRSDAEDIFQETYVNLFNALKAGREISEPEAYLMTIARRMEISSITEMRIRYIMCPRKELRTAL